jgi:hypothetical protein
VHILDVNEVGVTLADDVTQLTYSSDPRSLTPLNGQLYFRANVSREAFGVGTQLWRYDPSLGKSFEVPAIEEVETNLYPANGKLYFGGEYAGTSGLVEYDPSTASIEVFSVARSGREGVAPFVGEMFEHDGVLYFDNTDFALGSRLGKFDLASRSLSFTEIVDGRSYGGPRYFAETGGEIYFQTDVTRQKELWKYDPVNEIVELADDVNDNSSSSSNPSQLVSFGQAVYFTATGGKLWKFDPSLGNSIVVADTSSISALMLVEDKLFIAGNAASGIGLYEFDPTTNALAFIPGSGSTSSATPTSLTNHNGRIYVRQGSAATGPWELGEYDPVNGFATTIDIRPGTESGVTDNYVSFNGDLFFTATDEYQDTDGTLLGNTGTELYALVANPIVQNDALTLAEDDSGEINVLLSDVDPNEDIISIIGFAQATHGIVVQSGASTLRYSPNSDFVGADSFSYTVDDGNGNEATATVLVSVTRMALSFP